MFKRELIILFFLLIPLSFAKDVALIVRDNFSSREPVLFELERNNLSVDLISESNIINTNFSKYKFIVIPNQKFSNASNILINKYNSLTINQYNYYKTSSGDYQLGWSMSSSSQSASELKVRLLETNHPIVFNVSKTFNAYETSNINAFYLKGKPTNAKALAYLGTNTDNLCVAIIEPGSILLNKMIVLKRGVFFGLINSEYWTEDTRKLFDNSLKWLLYEEDSDGDGFPNNLDCDDNNPMINPNASEIPYNNIDEDCDGFDLLDADGDGFCKEGAVISNKQIQCFNELANVGTDCDDNNSLVNPNSAFLDSNCRNDAPIIEEISLNKDFFFTGDLVEINVKAIDPENKSLIYEINSTNFFRNGSSFYWKTNYSDFGVYSFLIRVSDGELFSEETISFNITQVNNPPIFLPFQNITLMQNTTYILNLSDYVFDEFPEILTFGIEEISEDFNVSFFLQNNTFILMPYENWSGRGWIKFFAFDGFNRTISDYVFFDVIYKNKNPVLVRQIENISLREGDFVKDFLNLSDYFMDVDSNLSFFVIGNNRVQITIFDGFASFIVPMNFTGIETIFFIATDGEYNVSSNQITINISYRNKPPIFGQMNCLRVIEEDKEYSCALNLSDPENDTINFSFSFNKLNCSVIDGILYYKSFSNYSGPAYCRISARDNQNNIRSLLFNVSIIDVNDAPVISKFSPNSSLILLPMNREKLFSIEAFDLENDSLSYFSFVNGFLESNEKTFSFKKSEAGNYFVQLIVSDGLLNSTKSWNVIVGEYEQFSCSEIGGSYPKEGMRCFGEKVKTNDSDSCCLSSYLPFFDDSCEAINNSVFVEIASPIEGEEYELNDSIDIKLYAENRLDKNEEFKISVFLYDSNSKDLINEDSRVIELRKNERKTQYFELNIPYDLKDSGKYTLYAKIEVQDEYNVCNHNLVEVNLKKPKHSVLIQNFNLPLEANCGDSISSSVDIFNNGDSNENISVYLRADKMNLSKKENFILKSDRKVRKVFLFDIPQNIKDGKYIIDAIVQYNGTTLTAKREVSINNCGKEEAVLSSYNQEGKVTFNAIKNAKLIKEEKQMNSNQTILLSLFSFSFTLLVSLILLLIVLKNKRRKKKDYFSISEEIKEEVLKEEDLDDFEESYY